MHVRRGVACAIFKCVFSHIRVILFSYIPMCDSVYNEVESTVREMCVNC